MRKETEHVEKNIYGDKAREYFLHGYNCTQSVVLAFSDIIRKSAGIEPQALVRVSSPFGGGMGRLREVCGAVSGMLMVLGALEGYDNPEDRQAKTELYRDVQLLAEQFERENGSIVCRQLLGLSERRQNYVPEARTGEYYEKRPCPEMVRSAASILEEYLRERKYI
ncbi:MAG: C-GCAxxG-C-C family protein [Emergencia sp.]